MSDKKKQYRYYQNAISLTLYHPGGKTIAAETRREAEQAVEKIAKEKGLLVNVALS